MPKNSSYGQSLINFSRMINKKNLQFFIPFSLVKIRAQYIASVENVKTELGLFIDSVALRAGQTRWETGSAGERNEQTATDTGGARVERYMLLKNAGDSSLVFKIILAY